MKNKLLSDEDMLKALTDADELYKKYREYQEIVDLADVDCDCQQDDGFRDFNHPLTVEIINESYSGVFLCQNG